MARPAGWVISGLCGLLLFMLAAPIHAQPSSGCGSRPPVNPPTSLSLDGRDRAMIAVIPEHYRADTEHRLIFGFHGRTNSSAQVRSYYRLEHGDPGETIFVYPSATQNSSGHYGWWKRGDPAAELRDFALFDQLLTLFTEHYCIDLTRVFVVGHSLGATFANSLSCARGDRIRAAVTLGGGILRSDCKGRVAAMVLHNPKDDLVNINEGERARDSFLSQDDLTPPAVESEPRDFSCIRYGTPDTKHPVLWCPHHKDYNGRGKYYPHTWPPDAGRVAMKFLDGLPDL